MKQYARILFTQRLTVKAKKMGKGKNASKSTVSSIKMTPPPKYSSYVLLINLSDIQCHWDLTYTSKYLVVYKDHALPCKTCMTMSCMTITKPSPPIIQRWRNISDTDYHIKNPRKINELQVRVMPQLLHHRKIGAGVLIQGKFFIHTVYTHTIYNMFVLLLLITE